MRSIKNKLSKAVERLTNWKIKSIERRKKIHSQAIKIRDLVISRNLWKNKLMELSAKIQQENIVEVDSKKKF